MVDAETPGLTQQLTMTKHPQQLTTIAFELRSVGRTGYYHSSMERTGKERVFSDISHAVIGCAIAVHRELGPGLLEVAYRKCLARELELAGIPFEEERPLPVVYRDERVECGYRADLVVANKLIVELKAVATLLPIHEAQILSYLKLSGLRYGLLINFNVERLAKGLRSFVL